MTLRSFPSSSFRRFPNSEAAKMVIALAAVELEVGCLFGENCRPCVEASDILPVQFLRTQILEEQVLSLIHI